MDYEEDIMQQDELYIEYMRQVRYSFLPGIYGCLFPRLPRRSVDARYENHGRGDDRKQTAARLAQFAFFRSL